MNNRQIWWILYILCISVFFTFLKFPWLPMRSGVWIALLLLHIVWGSNIGSTYCLSAKVVKIFWKSFESDVWKSQIIFHYHSCQVEQATFVLTAPRLFLCICVELLVTRLPIVYIIPVIIISIMFPWSLFKKRLNWS